MSTRVRSAARAVKVTSTSLVLLGSVSTCQWGLMSQVEHEPLGRFVSQDAGPAALAAIGAAIDDVAPDVGLDDRLSDGVPGAGCDRQA